MAMAAARTGEPQIAIDALLKPSARNQFDQRGVNTGGPCPYLPGDGGLLVSKFEEKVSQCRPESEAKYAEGNGV